jgi:hypothetical protein
LFFLSDQGANNVLGVERKKAGLSQNSTIP